MSKNASDAQQQRLTPPENAAMITNSGFFGAAAQEIKITRKVLGFQVLVTLIGASIAYSKSTTLQFTLAVLCGGGISVANGALLAWRMARSALHSTYEAHYQLRLLYFYAAERFLVVIVLLAICMTALKLPPLGLMGGFVMVQSAMIAARLFLSKLKNDKDSD